MLDMATGELVSGPPSFVPYGKMPLDTNCWPTRKLDAIKKWVALEKIHGANFSFTVNVDVHASGSKIDPPRPAKRSGYLKSEENFFRLKKHPEFLEKEGEKIRKVFDAVCSNYFSDVSSVTVFGELFGGGYPHPDVPRVPKTALVQGEIYYCPDLKFIAYDVAVKHGTDREFLDYDMCMRLFSDAGILYAEPLLTGTLQDMLALELGFKTNLPAKFGLPPLEDKNTAEGVVIKPLKNTVLDTSKGPQRVIFKRKVEQFQERKPRGRPPNSKETGKSQTKKGKKSRECDQHETNLQLLQYEMSALVTEQRVVNTISKLGIPESASEWTELVEAVVRDVLESAECENEELWQSCGGAAGIDETMQGLREECTQTVDDYRIQHSLNEI